MKKHISLILIAITFLSSNVFSQTIYASGIITNNTTWSADTVKITDNITVQIPAVLTINPGTYIEFQGYFNIVINSRLLAVGNVNDSITFTVNDTVGFFVDTTSAGAWKGIVLSTSANADTSIISYCHFEFSKGYLISIYNEKTIIENNTFNNINNCISVYNNSFSIIRNNIIKNCKGIGIICNTYNNVIISNNILFNNFIGIWIELFADIKDNSISSCIYGIRGRNSEARIINNEIINNTFGIYISNNIFQAVDCYIFRNKISNNSSGGILCGGASPVIINNEISYNTAIGGAGIMCCNSDGLYSNPLIIYNKICNNQSTGYGCSYTDGGSAILSLESSPFIINNIIANNSSEYKGTIYCLDTSDAVLINNTLVNNIAWRGGGVYVTNSKLKATNNILWGNQVTSIGNQLYVGPSVSVLEIENCCIQDTTNSNIPNFAMFQNNIFNDPLFVNPTTGAGIAFDGLIADWSLQPNSPCVDAGKQDTTGLHLDSTDIAGNNRVLGGRIDIGAFESIKDTVTYKHSSSGAFGLFIYPNPAKDNVSLIILNTLRGRLQLNITDIRGKTVYVEDITNNFLYYNKSINLTTFPNGIYLISVFYENGNVISQKVIKK